MSAVEQLKEGKTNTQEVLTLQGIQDKYRQTVDKKAQRVLSQLQTFEEIKEIYVIGDCSGFVIVISPDTIATRECLALKLQNFNKDVPPFTYIVVDKSDEWDLLSTEEKEMRIQEDYGSFSCKPHYVSTTATLKYVNKEPAIRDTDDLVRLKNSILDAGLKIRVGKRITVVNFPTL